MKSNEYNSADDIDNDNREIIKRIDKLIYDNICKYLAIVYNVVVKN